MIRVKHLGVPVAVAVLALAAPAAAQFGSIFGGPQRPPADIPETNRDPHLPPLTQEERERDPWYSSRQPPPEPPPPPLTRLPPNTPGAAPPQPGVPQPGVLQPGVPRPGGVQTQPLPPPPGVPSAPAPAPDVASRPQSPLPGLPPGQRQPRGTPQQPNDEVVVAPPSQKIVNAMAVFAGLDKITGRIISFDVAINETVQFGALRLTPRVCYTRPPTETPNTDGFIEVDEITLQGEVKRIFTGWMFAASPGLHGVEHPIYDVWLTDCKSDKPAVASAEQPERAQQPAAGEPPPPPATAPAPPQRPVGPGLRR